MDVVIVQSAPGAAVSYKLEFVGGQLVGSLGFQDGILALTGNLGVSAAAVLDAAAKALGNGPIVQAGETIIETGLGITPTPTPAAAPTSPTT